MDTSARRAFPGAGELGDTRPATAAPAPVPGDSTSPMTHARSGKDRASRLPQAAPPRVGAQPRPRSSLSGYQGAAQNPKSQLPAAGGRRPRPSWNLSGSGSPAPPPPPARARCLPGPQLARLPWTQAGRPKQHPSTGGRVERGHWGPGCQACSAAGCRLSPGHMARDAPRAGEQGCAGCLWKLCRPGLAQHGPRTLRTRACLLFFIIIIIFHSRARVSRGGAEGEGRANASRGTAERSSGLDPRSPRPRPSWSQDGPSLLTLTVSPRGHSMDAASAPQHGGRIG